MAWWGEKTYFIIFLNTPSNPKERFGKTLNESGDVLNIFRENPVRNSGKCLNIYLID